MIQSWISRLDAGQLQQLIAIALGDGSLGFDDMGLAVFLISLVLGKR